MKMMAGRVLLLLTTITLVYAQTGTYFVYENTVFASYSSWVISYSVDITPYRVHLSEILSEIYNFRSAIEELLQNAPANSVNSSEAYKVRMVRQQISDMLQHESKEFITEFEVIRDTLENIETLTVQANTRPKRSILPAVGNLMSFLFGVSTEDNVNRLRDSIYNIQDTNEQIVHVVSDSLTLINKSNEEIRTNRKALRKLTNATSKLRDEFQIFAQDLYLVLFPEFTYIQLVTRLQAIFNIISIHIRQIHLTLNDLQIQLQTSVQGNLSPSLITSQELEHVLLSIQKQLPNDIMLPYSTNRDGLLKYYQYLQPTLVTTRSGFHVLMAIPLMHQSTEYEIYRAVQVPVPNPDVRLGAQYSIESEYFAISRDKTFYIPLALNEILHCLDGPICQFNSPPYSVINYPQCITSLFLHDSQGVSVNCKKNIIEMGKPVLKQLFPQNYVISTVNPFNITILCPNKQKRIPVTSIYMFELNEGCSLDSKYFQLPKQIKGQTNIERDVQFSAQIEISKLATSIWNQSKTINSILSDSDTSLDEINNALPELDNVPIQQLQYILTKSLKPDGRTNAPIQQKPIYIWRERGINVGSTTVILIVACTILIVLRKRKFCKTRRSMRYICSKHPEKNMIVKYHKADSPPNNPIDPKKTPSLEHVTIVPETAQAEVH